VSLSRRSGTSRPRRRTTAIIAAATVVGAFAVGTTAAEAVLAPHHGGSDARSTGVSAHSTGVSTRTGGAPSKPAVWAMTVTGHQVKVAQPTFIATPVHPEAITHPSRDFMGSTVASHFKGGSIRGVMSDAAVPQLPGIDVSAYQGDIGWSGVCRYIDFSYAKATEGTYYTNPDFYNQYEGPYDCGLVRGAYHFANPANSSGESQAEYFLAHGGGWSGDGHTLPGALDIEYNPYGPTCDNLTQPQMVDWVWDFVNEYAYREHVYPVIYTTTNWWSECTGNYGGFGRYDPLWIANYSDAHGGPLPNGWGFYTFWQYRDSGSLPGDQDVFNGADSQLKLIADRG
jgi:GH25 family lysozyme M1 (1,4-beta-N-acetylmuramidase)